MKRTKKFLFPLLACALLTGYACVGSDDNDDCTNATIQCKDANTLQICVSGAWMISPCPSEKPVCDADQKKCVKAPTQCTNGTKQCKDANTLQICVDGAWQDSACSGDMPVCDLGRCVAKETECTDGTSQCKDASTLQICEKGTWQDSPCSSDMPVCDLDRCVAKETECTDGTNQCKDTSTLQICEKGTWQDSPCSSDKPVCSSGTCIADGSDLPADVPTSCVRGSSPAVCSAITGNVYFCGDTGTYYTNAAGTCTTDKKCIVCDNGFGGCGINCGGDLPADVPTSCVRGTDPAVCSEITGNAYFCGDEGIYYTNATGTCTADKKCIVCDNGFGGCGITCEGGGDLPVDVPTSCIKGMSPAVCSTITGNAYFCGDMGYYLNATGICTTAKPCYVCGNGWGGCSADPMTDCKDRGGVAYPIY